MQERPPPLAKPFCLSTAAKRLPLLLEHAGKIGALLLVATVGLCVTGFLDAPVQEVPGPVVELSDSRTPVRGLPPARVGTDVVTADDAGLLVQRSTAEFVDQDLLWRTILFFTGFGLYLLIALTFLVHWIYSSRDVAALSIALLALVMAVHTIAISGVVVYLDIGALNQRTVATAEVVTYLLLNGLIALLLWTFFPSQFRTLRLGDRGFPPVRQPLTDLAAADEAPAWDRSLNTALACLAIASSIVFALVPLFAPGSATTYVLSASRWITLLLMVVAVAVTLRYVEQRRRMTGGLAVGMGLIVIGSMHDVLFAGGDGQPYLITYTFLGFLLLHTFAVARRNVRNAELARQANERLSVAVATQTKELRAASIASQAANLAKSRYLSAVSHELRTPLTSMLGFTQILRNELEDKLNEQQKGFFDTIAASGERLISLINDLLDLDKMEAGHIELTIEDVEVGGLLADIANQLAPLARQKNLALSVALDDEPLRVQADRQRLRQVLLNLVSNAIKFTDRGGIRLRAGRKVVENDEPAVEIAVEDTGTGISPPFLPHLFDRFTQEPRSDKPRSSGTGLGLTISRELITRMRGHIWVESTVGAGSTFSVVLPAA